MFERNVNIEILQDIKDHLKIQNEWVNLECLLVFEVRNLH